MSFRYIAYTDDMRLTNGTIGAATESQAEAALQQRGYRILSLKAERSKLNSQRFLPALSEVKEQDIIAFSRQLATMVEAGISLLPALELLKEQSNSALGRVIAAVVADLRSGISFSDAVEKHPKAFSQFYVQMIRSGEQAGNLEVVLRQAASYIEKEKAITKKAARAMVYPGFVLIVALGVVLLMINVALPSMIEMFIGFKAELPWPTKLLVAITNVFTAYRLYMLLGAFAIFAMVAWYLKQPKGQLKLDSLLLKAPLLGKVVLLQEMTRFSRTMSMLLRAGLPSTEIMNIIVPTCKNRVVRKSLMGIQEEMLRGHGLSKPMAGDRLFPSLLVQMITIGEETGSLDTTLESLAESYETEVDDRVSKLISMLEPCLTIVIGLIVGFIVISMILPMYSIMSYMG